MTVLRTKSGVFVREDPSLGLLTYNPFSGLFYACAHKDLDPLLKWLNKNTPVPPSSVYEKALGVGWAIKAEEAEYPVPHLLPDPSNWIIVPPSYNPILINWLITGNCPLKCRYCYAQDVMHGQYSEPKEDNIEEIATNILKLHPLVVVLTGGDPLVSPYLEKAVKLLYRKAGIIVDTSGYTLKQAQIDLFKQYGVFVRISLDSEIPRINKYLRPVATGDKNVIRQFSNSAEAAVYSIATCVDSDIRVAVQSVATKKNQSDFEAFGNKLFKLGVSGWRILMVAPCKANIEMYGKLIGDETSEKRFYNHIVRQIMSKQKNLWYNRMSVQVARNNVPNDIILVAPDGTFLTESNVNSPNSGKVVIDPESPKRPRLEIIRTHVNMHAHTARYLNLETYSAIRRKE